jgi:hypothetical protein
MSNQGDIQERMAAARREAEQLKEKIRARRDASADTTCESHTDTLTIFLAHFMIFSPVQCEP